MWGSLADHVTVRPSPRWGLLIGNSGSQNQPPGHAVYAEVAKMEVLVYSAAIVDAAAFGVHLMNRIFAVQEQLV